MVRKYLWPCKEETKQGSQMSICIRLKGLLAWEIL